MSPSTFNFPSDFEAGNSSDTLSGTSRHSGARNSRFSPLSDMGPSAQSGPRDFGGFFLPSGNNISQSQHTFAGSSVCILLPLPGFLILQKRSTPYGTHPFHQAGLYDHPVAQRNDMVNEFLTMRDERDYWRTKYNELKCVVFHFILPRWIYATICEFILVICVYSLAMKVFLRD